MNAIKSRSSLRIPAFFLLFFAPVVALFSFSIPAAAKSFDLGFSFEPNQGQATPDVKFISRGKGYTLLLTDSGANLSLARPDQAIQTVRMKLAGAGVHGEISGAGRLDRVTNYVSGNDSQNWLIGVPNYATVKYTDVYTGTDLVYYGNKGQLEYDFIVRPGADPGGIKFAFQGAEKLHLDQDGQLVLKLDGGEILLHKPVAFQTIDGERKAVESRYDLDGNTVKFRLGAYDQSRELVIDPVLTYSEFLTPTHSTAISFGRAIAVDSAQNAYVAGNSNDVIPPGKSTLKQDAFIAKFDVNGNSKYITYFGGTTGSDDAYGVAVDSTGNAYIIGETKSADLATTPGAYQTTANPNPADHAFVAKFNSTGAPVYATYLGGSGFERGMAIAVDSSNRAYVTGYTSSFDFPTTTATISPGINNNNGPGPIDAFVSVLSANGSSLAFSTLLGGSSTDFGSGIAVDSTTGNVYVTGATYSSDFQTKSGQSSLNNGAGTGSSDTFVTEITNVTGSSPSLAYSTLLSGTNSDEGNAIALDGSGNVLIAGDTTSPDFPVTTGGGLIGTRDGFITKLNASFGVMYSMHIGGSDDNVATAVAAAGDGTVYVAGRTSSIDFPRMDPVQTTNAVPSTSGGPIYDGFVSQFSPTGGLERSTTIGGAASNDYAYGIAVDSAANIYVAGQTFSSDFIVAGPYGQTYPGQQTAFVTSIQPVGNLAALSSVTIASSIAGGATVQGTVKITRTGSSTGTVTVNLSSNTSNLTVPQLVTLTGSATSATFTATAANSNFTATVTAELAGVTSAANVTISTPAQIQNFGITTDANLNVAKGVLSGTPTTGGGMILPGQIVTIPVTLTSSDPAHVPVPSQPLNITTGSTGFTFAQPTNDVSVLTTVTVWATISGASPTCTTSTNSCFPFTFTLVPRTVTSLSFNPSPVTGGSPSTATVIITSSSIQTDLPTAAFTVSLQSANTTLASVPSTITIPSGLNATTFTVNTTEPAATTPVNITASANGTSVMTPLQIATVPRTLTGLTFNPTSVISPNVSIGTVTISLAVVADTPVTLSSTPAGLVPSSVTIKAGTSSATFNTLASAAPNSYSVTATLGSSTVSTAFTVNPAPQVTSISPATTTVVAGATPQLTVTISAAQPTNTTVALSSTDSTHAGVPATVTVLAGATTANFVVTTTDVVNTTTATITATFGKSVTATVTITPVPRTVTSLTLSPSTVTGGAPSTGTVTLSGLAPTAGVSVSLSSDSASAAVPATVSVAGGANQATFTITTTNPSAQVIGNITASANGGGQTAQLAINPFVISAATVGLLNHSPNLNSGNVQGTIEVLLSENFALNGNLNFNGNLLVPGTPTIKLNGHPTYGGTLDGTGSTSPSNKTITLNGNVTLTHVIRRTDPIPMPTVSAPPIPTGTRDLNMDGNGDADDNPGDFSTVRNITLNGKTGQLAVPPGTYGNLTANGNSAFVFGVAGSTTPAFYNLQNLNVTGQSQILIVGPVVLTVAHAVALNGSVGISTQPSWLTLQVYNGGVALNGNAAFYGYITAPNGPVNINGNTALYGGVVADSLTLNGNGLLNLIPQ